jgi:hypothetical protein
MTNRTVAEPVEATSMTNRPVRCPFDKLRDRASTGVVVTRPKAAPVEATSMTNRPVKCPFDKLSDVCRSITTGCTVRRRLYHNLLGIHF